MTRRFATAATLLLLACTHGLRAQDLASESAALLRGVDKIDVASAVPGPLCVYGTGAAPVLAAREKKSASAEVLVAIARHGKGKVAVVGHGAFLGKKSLQSEGGGSLVRNLIGWLVQGKDSPRVGFVGNGELRAFVTKSGERWRARDGKLDTLADTELLVFDDFDRLDDAGITALRKWIEDGGALLTSGLGWGWLQLHPGQSLQKDHRGNRFLAPLGIAFTAGTSPARFEPAKVDAKLLHARTALAALSAPERKDLGPDALAQIATTLTLAVAALPASDPFLGEIRRLVADVGAVAITERAPLRKTDVLPRLAVRLAHELSIALPADQVRADPSAADFPGAVAKDAPRGALDLRIDLALPGWAGTGLYAAPGETIALTIKDAADVSGLRLRIGCHTDQLWDHDVWNRHPEISRSTRLDPLTTTLASPFGGLVYVEVPRDRTGSLDVSIEGAVKAPRFVRGVTTNAQWQQELRMAPAPWAELEAKQVVITVLAEHVRKLEDAQRVVEFWDRVLDCYAELGQRQNRVGPERMVTDRQISAGYMHSGYPIMTHLDVGARFLDVDGLLKNPGEGWGFWHELGHNHQQGPWTFGGTTEVTCNLFSLFVIEKLGGKKSIENERFAQMPRKLEKHRKDGASFAKWQADPFLALYMYAQLQDAFGWSTFQAVFAEYRAAAAKDLPKTDEQKRDQWLVRFSRATGKNLAPFFRAWGVPISEAAAKSVEALPAWVGGTR